MKALEIPLKPRSQNFAIALAGVTYQLTLYWNGQSACWMLDIATSSRAPLIQGIPVVTGLDLLYQYEYLGIGGSLIVQTDAAPDTVPSYSDLGVNGHIYFVTG
jgi:hypothetical protein